MRYFHFIMFFIVFSIHSTVSYSQHLDNGLEHGTIIIGISGKDGILLISDSRAITQTDINNPKTQLAYRDSVQKIYIINNYPIAIGGYLSFGEKYMCDIVKEYNALKRKYSMPKEIIKDFKDYLLSKYVSCYPLLRLNTFISGYYDGIKPYLIMAKLEEPVKETYGYVVSEVISDFPNNMYEKSFLELIEIAKSKIYEYVTKEGAQNKIGGPLTIYKIIYGNNWIPYSNDFSQKQISTYSDFIKAVENDNIKMNYLYDTNKKSLLKILKANRLTFIKCD